VNKGTRRERSGIRDERIFIEAATTALNPDTSVLGVFTSQYKTNEADLTTAVTRR
jgi:hypothetical protein